MKKGLNNIMKTMDLEKNNSLDFELSYDFDVPFTNDLLFAKVMENQSALIPFLEDIIDISINSIEYIDGQKTIESIHKDKISYSRLDVIVSTDVGYIDVELQRKVFINQARRARYYSSLIDSKFEKNTGKEKYNLKDSYVIFLNEHGIKSYSHYIMKDQDNDCLNDGRHIIFINYTKWQYFEKEYLSSTCAMLSGVVKQNNFSKHLIDLISDIMSMSEWRDLIMTECEVYEDYFESGVETAKLNILKEQISNARKQGLPDDKIFSLLKSLSGESYTDKDINEAFKLLN